jgi:hypothetical protein
MSRRTHDRTDYHKDELRATLVNLSQAIQGHAAGTDVETVLRDLWERLTLMEGPPPPNFTIDAILRRVATGSFSLDAALSILHFGSFTADSMLRREVASSFTIDSWKQGGGQILIDSVILREQLASFLADAVLRRVESGSMSLDAWIAMGGSFTMDAIKRATRTGSFTANASLLGTRIVRPASDVTTGGTVTYSSGTTAYTLIDETVLNTGDWVRCFAAATYFVVQCDNPGITGSIQKIVVEWRGANAAPASSGAVIVRNPATGTRYDIQTISQSGSTYSTTLTARPWDNQPWTASDVNQLQIGARGPNSGSLNKVQTNQMYVTVYIY